MLLANLKGDAVKHVAIAFLFLCCTLVWAAPSASDYDINVHVSATRMTRHGNSAFYQSLGVIIDGKRYELESLGAPNALLMLGDYKARLAKDQHWAGGTYDSWRVYEFLFPDNKKRQFVVVGQSE
jgi:hypothetical protein